MLQIGSEVVNVDRITPGSGFMWKPPQKMLRPHPAKH